MIGNKREIRQWRRRITGGMKRYISPEKQDV